MLYWWSDLSASSCSAGLSGSCLWSCLPLWSGSGMDFPCQPPQTLSIVQSSRNGSISSGPSARYWPVSLIEGPSRAGSLTYSKESWKQDLFNCIKNNVVHLNTGSIYVTLCPAVCLLNAFSPLTCSVSSHRRVYPTWPCATAASLLLRPSASWKICAGSSQLASRALLFPWQTDRICFWNLVSRKRSRHLKFLFMLWIQIWCLFWCFKLKKHKKYNYLSSGCQLTDRKIQKLKQQYNQSGGPALEVTLAEVQDDLRIHPPQVIRLEDVELTNGIRNGHVAQSPGSGKTVDSIVSTALQYSSVLL